MNGRRAGVAMTAVFIGAEVVMAGTFALTGMAGWQGVANATPPPCEYEDGNTNGLPCLWVDPDTGIAYPVGSENYR